MFDTSTSPRELSDSELAEELLAKCEQIDALRAEQSTLVAEFDARTVYAVDGPPMRRCGWRLGPA